MLIQSGFVEWVPLEVQQAVTLYVESMLRLALQNLHQPHFCIFMPNHVKIAR